MAAWASALIPLLARVFPPLRLNLPHRSHRLESMQSRHLALLTSSSYPFSFTASHRLAARITSAKHFYPPPLLPASSIVRTSIAATAARVFSSAPPPPTPTPPPAATRISHCAPRGPRPSMEESLRRRSLIANHLNDVGTKDVGTNSGQGERDNDHARLIDRISGRTNDNRTPPPQPSSHFPPPPSSFVSSPSSTSTTRRPSATSLYPRIPQKRQLSFTSSSPSSSPHLDHPNAAQFSTNPHSSSQHPTHMADSTSDWRAGAGAGIGPTSGGGGGGGRNRNAKGRGRQKGGGQQSAQKGGNGGGGGNAK